MFNEERHFEQPIRWAMVGGGRGSQIGYSHRNAAQRDGLFKLVAGAFDLDADRCRDFGENLGLDGGTVATQITKRCLRRKRNAKMAFKLFR